MSDIILQDSDGNDITLNSTDTPPLGITDLDGADITVSEPTGADISVSETQDDNITLSTSQADISLTDTDSGDITVSTEGQGPQGIQGEPGEGVPTGGTTGQILAKDTATDYDTSWINLSAANTTFDDTTFVSVSSGAITGSDVQEILDNQLAYLVTILTTLFGNVSTTQDEIDALEIVVAAISPGIWGSITGTLSSQTDLQSALDAKADDSEITTLTNSKVSKSGDTMTGNLTLAPSGTGSVIYIDSPQAAEIFVDRGSDAYQALVRFRTAAANSWYFGLYSTGNEDFELHKGGGGASGFIMDYTTQYLKLRYGLELTYSTASTVPYIDASKNLVSSVVTPTELGYLSGVTSAIQTQFTGKKTDSMATNMLLGRGTAGTGVIEEITLGTNLSLSGTTLNATGGSGATGFAWQDYEKTGTYVYVGYENASTSHWYIYRRTIATNTREYATGTSAYSTNWTGRAGLTYA